MEVLMGKILIGIWFFLGVFFIYYGIDCIRKGEIMVGGFKNVVTYHYYQHKNPVKFWFTVIFSCFLFGAVFLIAGIWYLFKG